MWSKAQKDQFELWSNQYSVPDLVYYDWGVRVAHQFLFYPSSTPESIMNFMMGRRKANPAVCYTDGSGTTTNKAAGIGVVIYEKGLDPVYIAENIGNGTNNRAELMAIWRAIKQFPDINRRFIVYSDSEYAIGSLTFDWSAQANAELIRHIREDLALRPNVRLEHVKGHEGTEGNEIADALANIGRKLVTTVSL